METRMVADAGSADCGFRMARRGAETPPVAAHGRTKVNPMLVALDCRVRGAALSKIILPVRRTAAGVRGGCGAWCAPVVWSDVGAILARVSAHMDSLAATRTGRRVSVTALDCLKSKYFRNSDGASLLCCTNHSTSSVLFAKSSGLGLSRVASISSKSTPLL